ncbi:hypothetical protein GGR53DRAFT_232489 [Hypoxylon sp. FL1150]|nr:hypothetical protein GGR53DRAFT_232489 [Hypoxylon sp. FL1150]
MVGFSQMVRRNFTLVGLIVSVAWMSVAFCIATMFECELDFWAIWGPTKYVLKHCVEPMEIVLGLCNADFVSGVAIICAPIPLPLVWRLRLSAKRKLAVTAAFLLGLW